MSTSNESDLTCGSIDKEVALETPEISEISELTETPENPESSINKNVESELEDREYYYDMETSSEKEEAIIKAFMSPDYDEMDKLVSYINSPLGDFFPVTDKMNGSAIKINDKVYEFIIEGGPWCSGEVLPTVPRGPGFERPLRTFVWG